MSAKEAAASRATWPPVFALLTALTQTEHFWRCVEQVHAAPEDDKLIDRLALPYARKHRAGQRALAELLRRAAADPVAEPREHARARLLIHAGTIAVWINAPVTSGDPQRAPRNRRVLERGARIVAWRGAGKCSRCGTPLAETQVKSPRGWTIWRDYCAPCEPGEPHKDREAVKAVLNEASAAILREPSPAAKRRAGRSPILRAP